ncbi:MAG TPA: hypothetical protein VGS16_10920 [Candidatus Dormibacteraeota bacterium]|nr:hypothetical protein [Candidatus Dormibacteraeota bacterium]
MVRGLLHRLGLVGAILIASALIFGAIAGGVVVHRLQATPTASSEQQQGDQGAEQRPAPAKKNKQASQGHHDSAEQGDHQDKDA